MLLKQLFRVITVLLVVVAVSLTPATVEVAKAQTQTGTIVYNLYATDGFQRLADGTILYSYGFIGGRRDLPLHFFTSALSKKNPETLVTGVTVPDPTAGPITAAELQLAGNAQFPAPLIYAATGDVVEIRLKNLGVNAQPKAPNDPHSIHLHGLDVDAANDGVPETSLGAIPANALLPGAGNVIVYMFTAPAAGTYMYHCHQEASIHVAMGMYGALVIYNQDDPAYTSLKGGGDGTGGGTLYGWHYDKETVMLLSDMDTNQNKAEQQASFFNNTLYRPQYWFINGLSFPSTIHVAPVGTPKPATWWNDWIKAHPGYDPFIIGSVTGADGTGDKVLLRVINMGFQNHPMHMHGYHAKVIGSDARAWTFANQAGVTPWGEGMEKNTLLIGSGETYDWLLNMGMQSMAGTYRNDASYPGGTQSRYTLGTNLPVSNLNTASPAIPDPFVLGKAYVGGPVVGPDGNQGAGGLPTELPTTTGQYFPFHNHNDYQATNNGVYPGGMFTMIMTLP